MRSSFLLHSLLGAAVLTLATALPGAARDADRPFRGTLPPTPLQIFVDAALVDARCRDVSVDFGALFQWGDAHGLPAATVLPLGRSRKAFETLYAQRAAVPDDTVCTALAGEADEAAPGVIRTR